MKKNTNKLPLSRRTVKVLDDDTLHEADGGRRPPTKNSVCFDPCLSFWPHC
jgi:hypothetical protein